MSIKPLDLQTLFLKMAHVGKEQATLQKSVENQQSREASHLIKEENDRDRSVNKAQEDKDADKIKDEEGNSSGRSCSGTKEKEEKYIEQLNFYREALEKDVDIVGEELLWLT